MVAIAKVSTIEEAIALAERFRAEGRYNLFRGQRHNWPVASSIGRLADPAERQAAEEAVDRFYGWIMATQGLEHYHDEEAMLAVAQHYGLATAFIDFSSEPTIAGFFAADHRTAQDKPKLMCVNEEYYLKNVHSLAKVVRNIAEAVEQIEFFRPLTPNLWRMEAQACVFLYAPFLGDVERGLYPFDYIAIEGAVGIPHIQRERIYPDRKSDLERLLDQYFSIEYRRPGVDALKALVASGIAHGFRMDGPDEFYLSPAAKPHNSWNLDEAGNWLEGRIPPEPFPDTSFPFQVTSDDWADALVSVADLSPIFEQAVRDGVLVRTRLESFQLGLLRFVDPDDEQPDPEWIDYVERALGDLWDGMRRLPYTGQQIATALTRCACFQICPGGEDMLMSDPIRVEFGANDGSYGQALVSRDRVWSAIRPDLRDVLKPDYADWVNNPNLALLWIPNPRMLFTFEGFVDLLASEVLPGQMKRSNKKRSRLFSPWRITRFGLP